MKSSFTDGIYRFDENLRSTMKTNYFTLMFFSILTTLAYSQVGIGTTSPDATLHIVGTTTLGSTGGTTDLINEDFSSYAVIQNYTPDASCTTTSGWVTSSAAPATYECTNCVGSYLYIDSDDSGCDQDATVLMTFVPTTTSVDISFDYAVIEYSSGADSFRVYLHDGVSQVGADLLNVNTGGDTDASYSGTIAVTANTSYTIRFEYLGTYAYGATVDNVLITETSTPSTGNYTFRLEDGQQQPGHVLTSDANGYATWMAPSGGSGTDNQTLSLSGNQLSISNGNTVTIPSSGGTGSYDFENGLTESSGTVRLGGVLTNDTYLDLNSNDIYFEGSGTGNITFEDNSGQPAMTTNFADGYINFGSGNAFVDADDGTTFTDTYGGGPFTKGFVLGAYDGSSGGTAIALGSIEYVVDGTNELFYQGGAFSPMTNLGADLGAYPFSGTTRMWDDVYADDFITPTNTYPRSSGRTSNLNQRGLAEILRLRPISYLDNTSIVDRTIIPDNLKETKLGFYANELLEVIPEAVKTSDWVNLDESGKKTRVVYDSPKGIMPYQIIPVTVKAIQEQQEQIDLLKSSINELKKQNELLKAMIESKE